MLFCVLWCYARKPRQAGLISGLFALLYGIFRLFVECFREPDAQLGYFLGGYVTAGQLLSLPLVGLGVMLLWRARSCRGSIAMEEPRSHETIS